MDSSSVPFAVSSSDPRSISGGSTSYTGGKVLPSTAARTFASTLGRRDSYKSRMARRRASGAGDDARRPASCTASGAGGPPGAKGGNANSAGFMWSIVIHGSDPVPFQSEGCDFDGKGGAYTPSYDLSMQNFDGDYETFDFGDDAYVICDATTVSCAK